MSDWRKLARDLDWSLSYVEEDAVFPAATTGRKHGDSATWAAFDEPFKTSYADYVKTQSEKDAAVAAVRAAVGGVEDAKALSPSWINALKLHSATLPLAEFAAVVGNLRAARFGRAPAWRNAALVGALDELRHTQIPLGVMHELVKWDRQFDWTHKFYHTDNWVSIAARRLADELLIMADPLEFAIGTNFVFETGFTNLQFVGLSSLARDAGDRMFETMVKSIQTDEARHAQIGPTVLKILVEHDPEYAQALVDKWFWRSWLLFAVVTGFSIDYLTPVAQRRHSFKEFVEEWVLGQFLASLDRFGLKKPWYWDTFLESIDTYHHMVYASAYTYRATVWFNFSLPGPEERAWLAKHYPKTWHEFDGIWERVADKWRATDPGVDFNVHGTAIVTFCDLCQLVLCHGRPSHNHARVVDGPSGRRIFCSEPCQKLFEKERERYEGRYEIVKRVLAGEFPGNVVALIQERFGLRYEDWGKDAFGGEYPWLARKPVEDRC